MTSFETINLDDYKKLVANEKKIFDLTENFTTSEILNKYRHSDRNIDKKIKEKEKYDNLDKIINKNIDKIKENSVNKITNNYYSNINDEIKDEKYMEYINEKMNNDIINSYEEEEEYKFDNDDSILDSFKRIYRKHDIKYKPQQNTKFIRVRYLLQKLKDNDDIDKNLYNHFHTSLSEKNKLYHKIPTQEDKYQEGSSINNIIINNKDLNNGILRVRYLNNRKLTNNLLKHDYKISKNMVNAIRFNKDLHKLSKNELKIYHELQKFLNKEQDINILIGSYLSGNNSKKLYNKISSMLYHKLKNNIISKREYTKLINKINKI